MVLHFEYSLTHALQKIQAEGYQELIVHEKEIVRDIYSSCEIVERYGEAKYQVVGLINQRYNTTFDHLNWINQNIADEVAYFLNEAGSNVLSYSEFKAPFKFHLWFGQKGFIIGIEQKGKGFNAEEIHQRKFKENEGAAFDFFRSCRNNIFFDNHNQARIVFFEFMF